MGKIIDLTGKRFGKLTVLEMEQEKHGSQFRWKCQCDCGNTTFVAGGNLRNGTTKSCGCGRYKESKDLTGKRFGKLTVIKQAEERKNGQICWVCQCDCGNVVVKRRGALTGGVSSCGCNTRLDDLTGRRFGRLTVIERAENTAKGRVQWKCQCDCGNEVIVTPDHLKDGHTQSCGCYRDEKIKEYEDLIGQKFGRWTVVELFEKYSDGHSFKWKCQCDCGNIGYISGGALKSGNSKSCGCLASELKSSRMKENHPDRPIIDMVGQRFGNLTVEKMADRTDDGKIRWICRCDCGNTVTLTRSALRKNKKLHCGCMDEVSYRKAYPRLNGIWGNMKQRCTNANNNSYSGYGGRGITVCKEWMDDFTKFAEWALRNGYRDDLTIDRKDNNKGYSPDNCRWITNFEQQSNTRKNVYVTYKGETHTVSEWSRITGIDIGTIRYRLSEQWELDEVFEEKPHKRQARIKR